VGTSAIDPQGALLDYDFREVKVSQAIIENSRQIILVSDRSKFERTAPIRVAHISQVNVFVTDWLSSEPVAEICREHGVQVVEATGQPDDPD
jgi:DeoR family glycerol-3-phosphate regulon repressor